MRPRPFSALTVLLISICLTAIGVSEPQATDIKHDVFLFDVSGSMHGKPFRIRKTALENWVTAHHSGTATFLSFDTDISAPETFDLADKTNHKAALAWVKALRVGNARRTYVWHSCKNALDRVQQFVSPSSTSVSIHVLTDRGDNEHAITLEDVLEKFHAEEQSPSSWPGTGNVELKINYLGDLKPPPSPTPTVPPSPSVSPISDSTPTGTTAATATATATATVTTSPTPTATFTATATPTVAKPPVVAATPCGSQARPDTHVTFTLGEPRVIEHGQFVQFVNQTVPCADSYSWAATPIGSTKARPLKSDLEHWGTSFTNPDGKPLAYVVQLTATYGNTPIVAPPIALVVNPPPPWWKSFIQQILGWLAAISTLLPAINNFIKGVREYRASTRQNDRALRSREKTDAVRFFLRAALLFALFLAVIFLSGIWPMHSESQPPPENIRVPDGPTPTMTATPGSDKSGSTTSQLARPVSVPWSLLVPSLIGILLGLATAAWLKKSKGFSIFTGRLAPPLMRRRESPIDQMNELKQLCEAGVISQNEMAAFKRVILERVRTEYGLRETPDVRPPLPNDFKRLIDTLIEATERGVMKWHHSEGVGTDTAPPGGSEPEAVVPSRFFIKPEEYRSQDQEQDPPRVDIYSRDGGIVIDIRSGNATLIERIADTTFVISANRARLIRELYYLAKNSALDVEPSLKGLAETLRKRIWN